MYTIYGLDLYSNSTILLVSVYLGLWEGTVSGSHRRSCLWGKRSSSWPHCRGPSSTTSNSRPVEFETTNTFNQRNALYLQNQSLSFCINLMVCYIELSGDTLREYCLKQSRHTHKIIARWSDEPSVYHRVSCAYFNQSDIEQKSAAPNGASWSYDGFARSHLKTHLMLKFFTET